MARTLDAVIGQMTSAGMPEPEGMLQLNTHRVVRYGPKKRAWYRVWEMSGRSGRPYFVGAFGMHGRIESTRIAFDEADTDPAELARMREAAAAAQRREEARRKMRADRARLTAGEAWARAAVPDHPVGYLARKRVHVESVKAEPDEVILVPMIRYDFARAMALVGVQRIWTDGTKRFTAGTAKAGSCVRLGERPADGEVILLCEGLATGLSIRAAIRRTCSVFVAFDAGNLVDVAVVLRSLFPGSPLGVCIDDDYLTPGNPGYRYGLRAAKKVRNAQILAPRFAARVDKLTDFNDLHLAEGLDEAGRQLRPFLQFLERM